VLIPEAGAVLSAAGALMSELSSDYAQMLFATSGRFPYDKVNEVLASLAAEHTATAAHLEAQDKIRIRYGVTSLPAFVLALDELRQHIATPGTAQRLVKHLRSAVEPLAAARKEAASLETLEKLRQRARGGLSLDDASSIEILAETLRDLREGLDDLPDLLPGGKVRLTHSFDGVPPAERLTASLDLTSVDGQMTESASVSRFVWAWLLPLLLLLVVLALLVRRFLRGRSAKAGSEEPADTDPSARGDLDAEPTDDEDLVAAGTDG
jgi:hypothetical protein